MMVIESLTLTDGTSVNVNDLRGWRQEGYEKYWFSHENAEVKKEIKFGNNRQIQFFF